MEWKREAPDLCVNALNELDAAIASHFTLPEVQNLGSTSRCGCDFPHVTLTRGEWIGYVDVEVNDPELEASDRFNREALVDLLKKSGENLVELYGVWLDNDMPLSKPVNYREEMPVSQILEPTFCFKERGFYRVIL